MLGAAIGEVAVPLVALVHGDVLLAPFLEQRAELREIEAGPFAEGVQVRGGGRDVAEAVVDRFL